MCRSDAQVLGPNSQYLPKIVSIFAEVISDVCLLVLLNDTYVCCYADLCDSGGLLFLLAIILLFKLGFLWTN